LDVLHFLRIAIVEEQPGEDPMANKDQKKRNAKTNKPKLSAKEKKKKKKAAQQTS